MNVDPVEQDFRKNAANLINGCNLCNFRQSAKLV